MSQVSVINKSTVATSSNYQNDKADIDVAYANRQHGGSKTMWVITVLAILLIILFILAMIIFFFLGNTPEMHNVTVVNNTAIPITIIFGWFNGNSSDIFTPTTLQPGQSKIYKSTPGVTLRVGGLINEQLNGKDIDILVDTSPYTYVELSLAGQNYDGKLEISEGNEILKPPSRNRNLQDIYGVSMQQGYNLQMTIAATLNDDKNTNDPFSCVGPIWTHTIDSNGPNMCPLELQQLGTGGIYEGCYSPCDVYGNTGATGISYCCSATGACGITGGCENEWPSYDYYTVFHVACPNCLVTNCDQLNYHCSSESGRLTHYTITFTD